MCSADHSMVWYEGNKLGENYLLGDSQYTLAYYRKPVNIVRAIFIKLALNSL